MMQNLTLSVKQVNNYIKSIFDNEEMLIGISVFGEVTNFKISGGIAYFDIKEEDAQLSCIKFSTTVPFAKNGDKIIVTGRLNYHVRLGKLSFVAQKVELFGMGELYKKYLQLKAQLEEEGLFDVSKKQALPKYANKIGIVTSETGAVLRDIYNVTKSKNPCTDLLIYPARVQGVGAEKEIVKGIEYFNTQSDVDLIIVARGGGSFEDLSPFNTEEVARAAFASRLPIVSAIGHETDFSILDFVADIRTPTPSVAAEVSVFNLYEEVEYLESLKEAIKTRTQKVIDACIEKMQNLDNGIAKTMQNRLNLAEKDIISYATSARDLTQKIIDESRHRLEKVVARIEKSNPLEILKSGYAKVLKDGRSVQIEDISNGDELETYIQGGKFTSKVLKVEEDRK